jgi:DNA-binding transcriptional ArsR family regulator
MSAVLKALAEPRRVEILRLLRRRELAAGAIARRFAGTRPGISQHLRVLVRAGLVTERRERTRRLYRLNEVGFQELRKFLGEFWDEQLQSLKAAAEHEHRTTRGGRRRR